MNLSLSHEATLVRDTARRFFSERFPIRDLLFSANGAHAPIRERNLLRWKEITELGLLGSGCGSTNTVVEEMLIACEAGRSLAPISIPSSMLAAHAAAASGRLEVADQILAGESSCSPAIATSSSTDQVMQYLCSAETAPAYGLFLNRQAEIRPLPGIDLDTLEPSVDPSTPLSGGRLHTSDSDAIGLIDRLRIHADILVSGTLIGICEASRDHAVQHARDRTQFGKPIGSFQAIKHRCAMMHVYTCTAQSQLWIATAALRSNDHRSRFHATSALIVATRTAFFNARNLIQILGAMGITDEHPAHLYLGRAHLIRQLLGGNRANPSATLDYPELVAASAVN
jgi:hypothetical protein